MPETVPPVCAKFHRAVELIGSRWTGAIIQTLLKGKTRYAQIKAAVPDITDRMLSERLRSLETEGLVTRMVLPESPVRVEYELTDMGRSLESALKEIGNWAERWFPVDSPDQVKVPTTVERLQHSEPRALAPTHRGPRIRAR